jgi:hypothetical protein
MPLTKRKTAAKKSEDFSGEGRPPYRPKIDLGTGQSPSLPDYGVVKLGAFYLGQAVAAVYDCRIK